MYRDASRYYPSLTQFNGADFHVWEAMGNIEYFTELPDDWFGKPFYE
jgi:hypothetical protein